MNEPTKPTMADASEPTWDERQQRMLLAMGLRVWTAPVVATLPAAAPAAGATRRVGAPSPVAVPVPAGEPSPVPARPVASAFAAGSGPAHGASARVGAGAGSASGVGAGAVPEPVAAAPAVAVAGLGWDALEQAAQACRACALCDSRRQVVFGAGHRQAAWLIVGEAPGAEEDASGQPFVGPSGQLLDAMLAALGLSREAESDPARRVYIANTLKCRPPSNRNPQPQELQQCRPFLQRQIELLQPRVVLAMGRFAAQALLGSTEPIGQLRGRVHQGAAGRVVVTYHPSYLLRSPAEKHKAWADLCLAASAI